MEIVLGPITFYNGTKMPIIGLGTWQSSPDEVEKAVDVALQAGYRHIDTAATYGNEAAIGRALQKWFESGKIKRDDLFIVTKLPPVGNRAECVEKYLKKSLAALQLKYVDLYLIHYPVGLQEIQDESFPKDKDGNILFDMNTDHISLWKAMETQVDEGRALSIGLSNFSAEQIKRIWRSARIRPANLQVELHVYHQQRELRAFCRALDITIVSYFTLGSPRYYSYIENLGLDVSRIPKQHPLSDAVVLRIAQKHGKSAAQVLLRFVMQLGVAVIPKSTNPEHIQQNFDVFDFELSPEDMYSLEALDKGERGRQVNDVIFPGQENHPEYPWKYRY
ncbi:1,5-anhydro-D-fructose reductase-like [Schistocerca piceifrons]|uniref:1,5-anhydro-D-fructose reductase-like n=1 Tax=Schistocerca piceifrons TaxID=274613 RepID=UPI001F5E553F|nr:1,5-anhydro-D-fructose reductase-like [Schistocerca piceifrons]